MNDVISESKNEKAIYEATPVKLIAGISNHLDENPEKEKFKILNAGIINDVKYKTIDEATQRNNPNVTRFMGRSNILIIGLAIKETKEIAMPAVNRVS